MNNNITFLKKLNNYQWTKLLEIIISYPIRNVKTKISDNHIIVYYQLEDETLDGKVWKNSVIFFTNDFRSPGYKRTQLPYIKYMFSQFGNEFKSAFLDDYWNSLLNFDNTENFDNFDF